MRFNVHAGHNFNVPGADGYFSETVEDRNVKNAVIDKLRGLGHEVHDCTDEDGRTQSQNLRNIVANCNSHDVDLDVSIHFNSYNGNAHGVEVCLFGNGRHRDAGKRICDEISNLGFTNRGIKDRSDLYVLRYTNALALLVECCFCDNEEDADRYDCNEMANAIVKGLTGEDVNDYHEPEHHSEPSSDESRHERVVEVIEECNKRREPGLHTEVIGTRGVGWQNQIVAKKYVDGIWWLKDVAGYWISSNCCRDVIFTCRFDGLNRRADMNWNSAVVGHDPEGYAHRIKELRNIDGTDMFRDIAGYCCSAHPKYMEKSLESCKF